MAKIEIPKVSNPPKTEDITTLIGYIKQLANQTALLAKSLDFVVNDANIEADNIKAKTITAGLINVDELSAISANIGEVTAGIIRGISIYGSLISTNETGYPKAYISNTENLLGVATSSGNSVTMEEGITGSPAVVYTVGGTKVGFIGMAFGSLGLRFDVPMYIGTPGELLQLDGSPVSVPSWSQLFNSDTGRTLQQELDDLQTQLNNKSNVGHTHSFTLSNHNHGNPDNAPSGGGTFTTST